MNGKELVRLIMRLIHEGREIIESQDLKSEAVMLVGSTGTGKSTLLQYINGVQLEAFLDEEDIYRLRAKSETEGLSGVGIGHLRVSYTRYPTVYSPMDKGFSYIDAPGFRSTGYNDIKDKDQIAAQNIADAYFRKIIMDKVKKVKMVLVVSREHLIDKAGAFKGILEEFMRFMQGIENSNGEEFERIKNSISIVVTKVASHNGMRIKEAVKTSLKNFIIQTTALQTDTMLNIKQVLENIIEHGRIAIFTAPNNLGDKRFDEVADIVGLIESKIVFVQKQYAKISVAIADEDVLVVRRALDEGPSTMVCGLDIKTDLDINRKMKEAINNSDYNQTQAQISTISASCETINKCGVLGLENFIKIVQANRQALGLADATIKEYVELERIVMFLINLLPRKDRDNYFKKEWAKELGLYDKLQKYIDSAREILADATAKVENGTLTLHGYNIKASQIEAEVKKYPNILNVVLQGLHTIEMDKDVLMPSVNVSMIAPNVVVLGDKTINLSGKEAVSHNSPKAAKGADGTKPHVPAHTKGFPTYNGGSGDNGLDGVPGNPGFSSGNLFIICAAMSNQQNLKVYANGGNGAKGQNGGDGGNGGNGGDVHPEWVVTWPHTQEDKKNHDGWEHHNVGDNHHFHTLVGGKGGCGGNGGRGGQGGDGGMAGKCSIIVDNSLANYEIKLETKNGNPGRDGAPGRPGNGGVQGRSAQCHWFKSHGNWHLDLSSDYGYGYNNRIAVKNSDNGVEVQGTNSENHQKPTPILEQNPALQLLDYKIFQRLEETRHANIMSEFFRSFRNCYENAGINFLKITTGDLLEEASALEEYRKIHGQNLDFALLYHSLLARLEKFMSALRKTSQTHTQEQKALNYLYANTLWSIACINALNDNLLIIDIEGYIKNLLKGNLKKLSSMKAAELRGEYQKQYQGQINGKITEAKSFLGLLAKEIEGQQQAVDSQILEAEKEAIIQESRKQRHALEETKRRINKARRKKIIFGALNIAMQGVGMVFPPFGALIAPVVSAGVAMATEPSFGKAIDFAKSVQNMPSAIKGLGEKKKLGQMNAALDFSSGFKLKQAIDVAKMARPIIKETRELLKEGSNDAQNLKDLDTQLSNLDAYIKWLEQFDTSEFNNYWQTTFGDIEKFQSALPDRSLASLEFSRFEAKHYFEKIKQNIVSMIGHFASSERFLDIARKTNELIDVSINISNRVQEYLEHIAFANYLTNLQTVDAQQIDVGVYTEEVKKLGISNQENIAREHYYRAIAAFKQRVFPFAEKFLEGISNFEAENYKAMEQNLEKILDGILNHKSVIAKTIDAAIHHGPFDTRKTSNPPFFTWSYLNYPITINSLLEGKKVILNAYTDKSRLDAIKFKTIKISFQHPRPDKQSIFDQQTENFKVFLKHNGISYYKYADDVYQMSSGGAIRIMYSFKTKIGGEPEHHNETWKKLPKDYGLLSPYTSWTVWLERIQKGESLAQDLRQRGITEEDKYDLNINLIGEGTYVDKKHGDTLNLYKHYRRARGYLMCDTLDQESTNEEEFINQKSGQKPRSKPCSKL